MLDYLFVLQTNLIIYSRFREDVSAFDLREGSMVTVLTVWENLGETNKTGLDV